MKKFITLAMALVMVVAMVSFAAAEDIAVTAGEGNAIEKLETVIDLSGEGSLTIVVKMNDSEHYGWGLGNFGANVNGTWTDSKIAAGGEIKCDDDKNATYTYTYKEIVESFGVTDASAIADLKFGTWNGGEIVSASYGAGAAQTGDAMNMIVIAGLAVVALAGAVVVANKKNA